MRPIFSACVFYFASPPFHRSERKTWRQSADSRVPILIQVHSRGNESAVFFFCSFLSDYLQALLISLPASLTPCPPPRAQLSLFPTSRLFSPRAAVPLMVFRISSVIESTSLTLCFAPLKFPPYSTLSSIFFFYALVPPRYSPSFMQSPSWIVPVSENAVLVAAGTENLRPSFSLSELEASPSSPPPLFFWFFLMYQVPDLYQLEPSSRRPF